MISSFTKQYVYGSGGYLTRVANYLKYAWYFIAFQRVNAYLTKVAIGSSLTKVDDEDPKSWEFSGFSQNGEDGILEVLTSKLKNPSRTVIEIGSNNGFENCSAYLVIVKKYYGLLIEAQKNLVDRSSIILNHLQCYHDIECKEINMDNISFLEENYSHLKNLDVFSIDIDSYDYFIAKQFLEYGFAPKIVVAEYNSSFGPKRAVTVPYSKSFFDLARKKHFESYYFGCSLQAYRNLFEKNGYRFIGVESSGVNCFFIKEEEFSAEFVDNLKIGHEFKENQSMFFTHRQSHEELFKKIKTRDFEKV